jgi:acetylornithine/succinyldiaminopimelate/putrescine aminotransferase
MEKEKSKTKAEVYELFGRYVSSGKPAFFKSVGIEFSPGKREGAYLWDLDGDKQLIDCHCNGGVFNLGHRNSEIIAVLQESLQEYDIGNHHLISEQRAILAEKIASLTPEELNYTVFGVGGGEAIDLAIKVARGYSKKRKVISAKGGYHGHTGLALAAGDAKYFAPFNSGYSDFLQVPFNDVQSLEAAIDDETAAVILETIPATYGISVPASDYLQQVRQLCDDKGAIMIIDEVQAGLGRTGKLWGFEHFGITPDIMVIGKGLSGGIYPITATIFKDKYESVFHADPFIHVSTFGGAEVGCAIALKVLEISSDPTFLNHVQHLGDMFADGFEQLKAKHPEVLVRLRQVGLMMGIEMVNEYCGPLFSKTAYDNGLLSVYANNDPRVAQLLPVLVIEEEMVEEILKRVDRALMGVKMVMSEM